MSRQRLLGRVADHLVARDAGSPLRVAVDGITAAGKSTFTAELALAVAARGRPAVHLSMDGFHRPRVDRYRQGRDSADGYYDDAFDVGALVAAVLRPLGPGGNGRYRSRVLDLGTDRPVADPPEHASVDTVLLVDGTFLQRPELDGQWDEIIWLAVSFDEVDVERRATVVVDNDDLDAPRLRRIGGDADSSVPLFSYGTLQLEPVQLATFGRRLAGRADRIVGFAQGWLTVRDIDVIAASGTDRHPIVRHTGDPAQAVVGTVLELTTAELAAADLYEVDDYRRVLAPLAGGGDAWVYVTA